MNDESDKIAALRMEAAEHARKHGRSGTFETGPVPAGVQFDWASAGLKIERGVAHLSESLPNGQCRRTEEAFKLLRQGVEELGCFLRARGLDV